MRQLNFLERLQRLFLVSVFSLTASIGFGFVLGGEISWSAALISVGTGAVIGIPLFSFEIFFVNSPLGERFRRQPFLFFVLVRAVVWGGWIWVGVWFSAAWIWQLPPTDLLISSNTWWTIAFSITLGSLIVMMLALNRLLGQGVLVNILLGRYHQPREEYRAFLFLDLIGSTAMVERIGAAAFLGVMNRFAYEVDHALEGRGGRIHSYVGDQVIVTWPIENSDDLAPAVATVFSLRRRIAHHADTYGREFGEVPQFRAALHVGPVAVGEIGDEKREIVLLGETVNLTARLEQVARELELEFIDSDTALQYTTPRPGWRAEQMGQFKPRGSGQKMEVHTIFLEDED